VKLWLVAIAAALSAAASGANGACMTDTQQSDFQAGLARNVDVNVTPGSVVLTKSFAVDQENTAVTAFGTPFTTTKWVGQTFTPGLSGLLTRVDLNFFCVSCPATPPTIVVSLRATSAGLPTGADLATATVPIVNGPQKFYSAIFPAPASVTQGVKYAVVVRPSTNPATGQIGFTRSGENSAGGDVYAGGDLINSANAGAAWNVQTFNNVDPTKQVTDAVFMTYIHGGYSPSGELQSAALDSNPPAGVSPSWTSLSWNSTAPAGTLLRFQAAASDSAGGPFVFTGPDQTAATFFDTPGVALPQFDGKRYLKYRAVFSSTSSTATPTLTDVTACFSTTATANLSISNSDGVASANAGSVAVYSITAANAGPANVTGAKVTDLFPAPLSCTWTCNGVGGGACTPEGWGNINDSINLPAGASANYIAVCSIATTATGSLANNASIATPVGVDDPTPADNSVTDTDSLSVNTNVTMSVSNDSNFVRVGDPVVYLIEVTNAGGPSDAVISVFDALPAQLGQGQWECLGSGSASCSGGSGNTLTDMATVPAGGKIDYLFSAVLLSESGNGQITNSASASLQFGTNQPSGIINASDTDTIVVFEDGFEPPPVP